MKETGSSGQQQSGATRELASFVSRLRYDDIPVEVISKAKACTLDALGCMLFGSTLRWTRIATNMHAQLA